MIAVISAADGEIGWLRAEAEIRRSDTYAGMPFYSGMLDTYDIVFARPGIGKVPTAMAAQIIIDRFDPEIMILSGPAGPLVPYLQQGDLVIANRVIPYDRIGIDRNSDSPGLISPEAAIGADPGLTARMTEVYTALFGGKSNRPQLIAGTIISTDNGISDRKVIGRLQRHFGAVAADREGAMAARVCRMNSLPFIMVRTIFDSVNTVAADGTDPAIPVIPGHMVSLIRQFITASLEAPVV